MAVLCSKCGEELLGAVNRCWKCGTPFVAPPTSADLPPIRRSPVPVVSSGATPSAGSLEAGVVAAEILGDASSTATLPQTRRRGSPFAESFTAGRKSTPAPATVSQPPPARAYQTPVNYARPSAATGGAVAALILGIVGLLSSYYIPIGALVVAFLGLGMGLWGLYSERRGVAIAGLLLCCLTLAIAGFFSAVDLYTFINGRQPWELDPELQGGPTSDY